MARLVWQCSDGSTQEFLLVRSVDLGRDPGVECTLDVRGVSRRHARIDCRSEGFFLTDLGSTNGTLLNGAPVTEEVRLKHRDRLQVGLEVLVFEEESPADPSRPKDPARSTMATEPLSRTLRYEGALATKEGPILRGLPEVLPRQVGKFELLEKLGQGGMGEVYRAHDQDADREVGVKFIRSHIGRRESFLEYFHNREAVLAREIDHPNVIRVYEHGVEGDRHYISMEYVEGENLYRVLKRRKLEPLEVLEILRQVASGLVAAHRQGVVHSDIKPANVLLLKSRVGTSVENDEAEEAEDGEPNSILEFDAEGEIAEESAGTEEKYEAGLLEEIRRRIGEPSGGVLEDPPYFERAAEMRFLEHYLERTKEKGGCLVLVEGEPGIGKDRLISEFLLRQKHLARNSPPAASGEGQGEVVAERFLELDCSRIEGIPLLYQQMCPGKPLPVQGLRQVVESLKTHLQQNPASTVIRLLNVGNATPLVCQLVAHWVSRMAEQPLLVLASLDPDDVRENDTLKALLESLGPDSKVLYLRPLTEYQIQRYLQDLFRESLPNADLASDLHRLCGGNFARLLDLLRSFFDREILTIDQLSGSVHYRPSLKEFELEEGKNLYEKYRLYSKVEQQILESAAFIGPRFFFDTLWRLFNVDETSLYFVVRHLLNDGFFTEESRTWYRFTNSAFQRYMAERIPPPERPHLHRKLSRLLQTVPVPESAELYQLRGHHLAGCREFGKAVHSLLEGAHLARNSYKTDLAREMYQEILRIYRNLAQRKTPRQEVTGVLRDWFRRDGNWYEILGALGAEEADVWVKIADFGISFRAADDARGYQVGKRPVLGTPRYLAPERGKGEHGGPRSDIFSLGIIAYEMVVGEPPFPELKGAKVVKMYQRKPIRVPAGALEKFPQGFDGLLGGMLEMDPARRWDAERVLKEIVKLQFDFQLGSRSGH